MDSILTSVKKMLGIAKEYEHFDADLIMHINSVFMVLSQLGVGPSEGFYISDKTSTWDEFVPEGANLELVKTYMYKKIQLIFDPPTSSAAMQATNELIKEFEWRLNVAADTPK